MLTVTLIYLIFQPQVDPNQWSGGYYGYAPGYETYGYAPAAQDPNLYYAGYPGYGNYPPPPQQQQQMMQQPQVYMPTCNKNSKVYILWCLPTNVRLFSFLLVTSLSFNSPRFRISLTDFFLYTDHLTSLLLFLTHYIQFFPLILAQFVFKFLAEHS